MIRKTTCPENLPDDTVEHLKKNAAIYGIDQVLGFLTKQACLLSPRDFASVIGHKDPEVAAQAEEAYDGLEQLLGDSTDVVALEPPVVQEKMPLGPELAKHLHQMTSMESAPVQRRVVKLTIIKPASKLASVDTAELEGLALLYNNYKLAFATQHQDRPDVLRNIAFTF
jgi:hypothetical protein